MTPTLLGLLLLPLVLRYAGDGERLLQLILVAAVFEGGAAAVIGGFGVQLGLVPTLAFLLHVTGQYLLGMRYRGEATVLGLAAPLLILLAYAAASALLLPQVFAGQVTVWPQKPDTLFPEPVLLAPGGGNLTQTLYLALNVFLAAAAALYLMRGSPRAWRRLVAAYMAGGYIVVGLALWNFVGRVTGLPFPTEVLHSNPSWVVVEQSLGPIPRIQGPFTEPSGLAFYMAGMAFCCLWLCVRGHDVMRPKLLLMLAILATCLSTSTTGIATLALGLPAALLLAAASGKAPGLRRTAVTLVGMAVLAALLMVPLVLLAPQLLDFADIVIESTLDKSGSDSFIERQMWDSLAWNALLESSGLGIGWGSTRSSSLLPGLLAGAGVFGVAMVLWLGVSLVRRLGRSRARGFARHPASVAVDGFIGAMAGQLLAAMLAAPTIVTPIFFLQLGTVIAGVVRFETDLADERRALPSSAGAPRRA